MNKKYTITLADGTTIDDLTLNGTNYISPKPVTSDIFAGNCSPMMISDGEIEDLHENAELVQIENYNGEYWIAFRDVSKQELKEAKIRSDIDYIAMMTDTDLEEV